MHQTTVLLRVPAGLKPPEPFETKIKRFMHFRDAEES
jgi:hypothetical protein